MLGALLCCGALLIGACAPTPTGPSTPTTAAPPAQEPFTVVLIGDSEARMRGNTNAEIAAYVDHLKSYDTTTVEHFDHDGGAYRVDPELVILAGDISADRDTSIDTDLHLWKPLYDQGIAFIAAAGNHDWEPLNFGDGSPGYSVAGHLSNENTRAFVRETYRRSAAASAGFTYDEVAPSSTHGPTNFHARYRGVEIINFNTFLYQPSYRYPQGWPLDCNLAGGGAGCQIFASAEPQITRMANTLDPDAYPTALFIQHYPLTTGEAWWSDYGVSGTTTAQRKGRLLDLMAQYDHAVLLAGHNHIEDRNTHHHDGADIEEIIAPYFGGNQGEDLDLGGGSFALLVSPTDGVLEVRRLHGPGGG